MGFTNVMSKVPSITIYVTLTMIFVAIMMNLNVAIKFHKNYEIGKRMEAECGKEVTEYETGRYAIYKTFVEGFAGKKPLQKQLNAANIMTRIALGLIIVALVAFMMSWILYSSQKLREKPGQKYPGAVIWLCTIAAISAVSLCVFSAIGILGNAIQTAKNGELMKLMDSSTSTTSAIDQVKALYQGGDFYKTITSAWFPLVLLSGVTFIGLAVFDNNDYTDVIQRDFVKIVFVYLLGLVFATVVSSSLIKLYASINGLYHERVRFLKTDVGVLTSNADANIRSKVKAYFKQNIESVLKNEVAADTVFTDYANDLWKFVQHKPNNEFYDLYKFVSTKTGDVYTSATNAIKNIRADMLKLRMRSKDMDKTTRSYVRNTIITTLVLLGTLTFMVFHYFFTKSPMHTVVGSALTMLVLTIVGTWFGWFSSAILL